MEFSFTTTYDLPALTRMARALRKTVRKKHSRRSRIYAAVVMTLGAVVLIFGDGTARKGLMVAVLAVMALTLIFEDKLNGFLALKRMAPGSNVAQTVFTEDCYRSSAKLGSTEWSYENIVAVAEDARYFIFLLGKSHAQLYDKQNMTGGTPEEFAAFISEKTGKNVIGI